jgi:hypothetical protein
MLGKYAQPIIEKIEKVRLAFSGHPERVFERNMEDRLFDETWKYIKDNLPRASCMRNWQSMFDYVAPRLAAGDILEFGVARGKTINYLADRLPGRKMYGFDSFESFPEPYVGWLDSHDKFDYKGVLPPVRDNVGLVKGFFDDTLQGFLDANPGDNVAFIHVDCDLYSSTKTVLNALKPRMKDTYIQFDEYFNYWCWQEHECKAFHEFMDENPSLNFEFVAFTWRQVLVKVTSR